MTSPLQPDPLLLASTSPRRLDLLKEHGYLFEASPPPFEEPDEKHPHVPPTLHAESIAFFKACSVARKYPGATILAADTFATLHNEIIGKPKDRDHAKRILTRLSDTRHDVVTGVALLHPASGHRMLRHSVSGVRVRSLSEDMIQSYLDTGEWEGKAGAYGIQEQGDGFVASLDGSFTNVVGLPMELLAQMFEQWLRDSTSFKPGRSLSVLDEE